MRKILLFLALLHGVLFAQTVQSGYVNYVTSAPSGSCSQNNRVRVVMGPGTVYSCQSGTWATVGGGGGGSGTVTSVLGTANQITSDGSTTTPTVSLSSTLVAPGTVTATTSVASPFFASTNADVADAGEIRLGNAETIAWEASPASTDVTMTVNSAEQFVFSNAILSPTLVTPALGTPASGVMTNVTGLTEAGQTLADNTTNNASTSAHGYLLKLNNSATSFMNGQGAWATPASSVTWDAIGNAAGALTLANGTNATTFNQTSAATWTWANTTAASSGTSQSSPIFNLSGKYWTGAASATDSWTLQNQLFTGTNSPSILTFAHSGSSGRNAVAFPDGVATGGPSITFASGTQTGFGSTSANLIHLFFASASAQMVFANGVFAMSSNDAMQWTSSTLLGGSVDVGLSRDAAGTLDVGSGAQGSTVGSLKASAYRVAGTKFTASGCSNGTTVGGATAGKFSSGTTGACTVTVTMGDSDTATNGWACFASDQTTPANIYTQTVGGSTTTAVFTGTTVSGDVISFGCMAY